MRRITELGAAALLGASAVALLYGASGTARRALGREDEAGLGGRKGGRSTAPDDGPQSRGRDAARPSDIPARGWKDILVRTFKEFGDDQIPLIAAGCTFYTLLALFPAITAFVALYGLFADVGEAQRHVAELRGLLPEGAVTLIGEQMTRVAAAGDSQLSLALVFGLGVALWSANKSMKAIITGLNIAYEETETRGLVRKTLTPLAFTTGLVVFAALAIGIGGLAAVAAERLGSILGLALMAVYWLGLFAGVVGVMALLYRFGPSRSLARWRWISWGSGLAATAWVAMSAGFTAYVANFGRYDETYGALGAVIGFMTWTWLSSMVFLMGAELNSEIEHQTARDTTTGAPLPLGRRGAVMADTVGAPV